MRLLFSILMFMVLTSATAKAPPGAWVVKDDRGGLVWRYVARWEQARARGERVVIDGFCASSCTLVLAHDNYCATPNAVFAFHQVSYSIWRNGGWEAVERDEEGTAMMMRAYPGPVRAWIRRKGGLTERLIELRGAELVGRVVTC